MQTDLNGRIPKVGDIIYRYGTYNKEVYYVIRKFSESGNPIISQIRYTHGKLGLTNWQEHIRNAKFVILDTPKIFDYYRSLGYTDSQKFKTDVQQLLNEQFLNK